MDKHNWNDIQDDLDATVIYMHHCPVCGAGWPYSARHETPVDQCPFCKLREDPDWEKGEETMVWIGDPKDDPANS